MPLPTPAELDARANALRDQAAALNRTEQAGIERGDAELGTQVDDARRAAVTARASAANATARANELHDKAQEFTGFAAKFEKDADDWVAQHPESPNDVMVQNFREQAAMLRASAAGYSQRAVRAEEVARDDLDHAQQYDRNATTLEHQQWDQSGALDSMRLAGLSLEDQAGHLEDAAQQLRSAAMPMYNAQERQAYLDKAQAAIDKADAIKPDFSKIDPNVLKDAGVPLSQIPGNELMNPNDDSGATPTSSADSPAGDDVAANGNTGIVPDAISGGGDSDLASDGDADTAAAANLEGPGDGTDAATADATGDASDASAVGDDVTAPAGDAFTTDDAAAQSVADDGTATNVDDGAYASDDGSHGTDDGSYAASDGYSSDDSSYAGDSYSDTGSYDDGGSYSDTGSYDDGGSYGDSTAYNDAGSYDSGSYDGGGYDDSGASSDDMAYQEG